MHRWLQRALVLVSGLWLAACGQVITLEYSAEDLNSKIRPLFPVSRNDDLLSVKLDQPEIVFNRAQNKLGLRFNVEAKSLGLTLRGRTLVEGVVEYRPANGSFYIASPAMTELAISGVPDFVAKPLRKLISFAADYALKDKPIYTFDPQNFKEQLARNHLNAVRISDNRLVVEVKI